ncbi:MAG: hypothetical protein P4L86_05765 [Mycobacterium sp.]|nr:hypothetical protein [Mycobacterium sp.]
MSTNITATMPALAFASGETAGRLPAAPTLPAGALAWSAEEPVDELNVPAPVVATPKRTRTARTTPGLVAAMLFGAVTVAAALGAIMLAGHGSPSTAPAIVDRTESAPHLPSVPAPVPAISPASVEAAVPAAAEISIPAVTPSEVVVPTPQVVQPTGAPAAPTGRHEWDLHKWEHRFFWDHQDQKH